MIVMNIEVPGPIMESAMARVRQREFTAASLTGSVASALVDSNIQLSEDSWAMRVADRIIQQERKAGRIMLTSSRMWQWVGGEA